MDRRTPDSRVEDAKAFGLQAEALAELTAWVTPRFDKSVRWPNILVDLTVATELVSLFLSSLPDIRVLELALHRSMVDEFCIAADPASQQPGFAPMGKAGVLELILKDSFPAKGGDILGFEPLVFNHSLSCSWLCNSLETVIEEALGIRPNRWGVIEGFEEARKCVEYISRDDVGAEPGLWLPWLLIDHTKRGEQGRLS